MIITNEFYVITSLLLFIALLYADETLSQGETKELHSHEERFIKLFKKGINEHSDMIGMCLLANDSRILKPTLICEIESHGECQNFACLVQCVSLHVFS